MKSKKPTRAQKRKIQNEMKTGMLDAVVAFAKLAGCHPSDLLPSYGDEHSSPEQKQRYSSDELVNTKDAAALLGLAPKTLENWRCQGKGPEFKNIGNRCHYRVRDLEAYLTANTFGSTSEYKER